MPVLSVLQRLFSSLSFTQLLVWHRNRGILIKINGISEKLDSVCEVRNGVQAYTVGEGDPKQTKDIKNNRAYHSKIKHDDNWIKYLDGADVERYKIKWSGQYIKYGNNLSRPRQPYLFQGERILVRQIPALPPYCIMATITTEQAVVDNNCLIVKIKDTNFNIKYILSILNSKLVSYWFIYTFGKLQRRTFPQFKVNELRLFPIRRIDSSSQQPYIKAVENILNLTASEDYLQDPIKQSQVQEYEEQIDQMVYKIYGLTEEEIRVVEEQTSARAVNKPVLVNPPPIEFTEQFIVS